MYHVKVWCPGLLLEKNNSYGFSEDQFESLDRANEWVASEKIKFEKYNKGIVLSEIENLKNNPEWVKKDKEEKIKAESPSLEECVEALIREAEGDSELLVNVLFRREAARIKYPKGNK